LHCVFWFSKKKGNDPKILLQFALVGIAYLLSTCKRGVENSHMGLKVGEK
jgi:hypothetical protein